VSAGIDRAPDRLCRISWTNYKERWFCLTRTSLVYYDGDDEAKRKEKGRIFMRDVQLVEQVTLEDRPHSFQIKYCEGGQEYTLYIQAKAEGEREEWVQLARNLVRHNQGLVDRFHPGVFTGGAAGDGRDWCPGKWLCGAETTNGAAGCQAISWTPRPTKTEPAPPVPLSDPLSLPAGGDGPALPERLVVCF
jgi:hypothetical protein